MSWRPSRSPTASGCRSRFLFLFLGAEPCTDWLGDVVARDEKGFVLTGAAADADALLETSVPGVYAAGDVRSGSVKRCATAVGEGAMVVQFIHGRIAEPCQRRAEGLSLKCFYGDDRLRRGRSVGAVASRGRR